MITRMNIAKKRSPTDKYGIHWCSVEFNDCDEEKLKEKVDMLRLLFGDTFVLYAPHRRENDSF